MRREIGPREDGAEVDEHGGVEEEVEDVREVCFFCFCGEPAVPGKAGASAEGDEEVIEAEGGAEADREDGEEKVEGEERGGVDVFSGFGEAERTVGEVADY